MKSFGFEAAHGYRILKGYVDAESKEQAIEMIMDEDWDDVLDEYSTTELTEGYKIIDIWECE